MAHKAGIRIVDTDEALVKQANLILSILVPSNAEEVVDRIIAASRYFPSFHHTYFSLFLLSFFFIFSILMCHRKEARKPLFVDLNAIAPETVQHFANKLNSEGIDIVDGGVLGGPAKNLGM